jgi:type IV secretory pathway component VirB8
LMIAVMEALVIYRMLPLKERVPYVMEVDNITGRVEIAERVLTKLNVSQANVDYALRLWTTRKESLNATTLTDVPKALAWTRGDAVKAFEDFVDKTKPAEALAKDPGTIREVQHQTIGYINDGKVALVRYNLVERRNGVEVSRVPKLLTATVALVPPPPDSKEERDNPIGLVISQFSISTEGSTGGNSK